MSEFDACWCCEPEHPAQVLGGSPQLLQCAVLSGSPQLLLEYAALWGPQCTFPTAYSAVCCPLRSSVVPHSFFWSCCPLRSSAYVPHSLFCSMLPSEVHSGSSHLLLQCTALWGPQRFRTASSAVYCPLRSSITSAVCCALEVLNDFCSVLRSWGPQLLLQCAALLKSSMTSAVSCSLEVLSDFCSVLPSWGPQWLLQCVALLRSSMTSAVCCPLTISGHAVEPGEESCRMCFGNDHF